MKEWGIKPWEMDKLTQQDLQDIGLAEHAQAFIKQEQRAMQEQGAGGSINTKSNLENRASKRKRIRQAKSN